MIGTFPGKLEFADGDEVDVDLEIAAGQLKLVTGISEIGSWPLGSCVLAPTGNGGFELTVDGDTVAFAPDHPDAFSDFVQQIVPYPRPGQNGSSVPGIESPPPASEPVDDTSETSDEDIAVTLEALFATEFGEEVSDEVLPRPPSESEPPMDPAAGPAGLPTSDRIDAATPPAPGDDSGEVDQASVWDPEDEPLNAIDVGPASLDADPYDVPDVEPASTPLDAESMTGDEDVDLVAEDVGHDADSLEVAGTDDVGAPFGQADDATGQPDSPFGSPDWFEPEEYDVPEWTPQSMPPSTSMRDEATSAAPDDAGTPSSAPSFEEPEYPDPFADADDTWPPRPLDEPASFGGDTVRAEPPADSGQAATAPWASAEPDDPWAPPEEGFGGAASADTIEAPQPGPHDEDSTDDRGWFRSSVGERLASVAGEIERLTEHPDDQGPSSEQSVAAEVLAANSQLRAGSQVIRDRKKLITRSVLAVVVLGLVGGLVFLTPKVIGAVSDWLAEEDVAVSDQGSEAVVASETTVGSETDDSVAASTTVPQESTMTVPVATNVFDLGAQAFAERWNEIGGALTTSFILPGVPRPGQSFTVTFTPYVGLSGTVDADGLITSYTVVWDTSGDGNDDRFGLNALGVAMSVADPDATGAELGQRLSSLGLDPNNPDLSTLNGTGNWNGVTHRLESDDAGNVRLSLTEEGTTPVGPADGLPVETTVAGEG